MQCNWGFASCEIMLYCYPVTLLQIFCGWALQEYSAVGHWDTLPLSTAAKLRAEGGDDMDFMKKQAGHACVRVHSKNVMLAKKCGRKHTFRNATQLLLVLLLSINPPATAIAQLLLLLLGRCWRGWPRRWWWCYDRYRSRCNRSTDFDFDDMATTGTH